MVDATLSHARMRDLARLGRTRPRTSRSRAQPHVEVEALPLACGIRVAAAPQLGLVRVGDEHEVDEPELLAGDSASHACGLASPGAPVDRAEPVEAELVVELERIRVADGDS